METKTKILVLLVLIILSLIGVILYTINTSLDMTCPNQRLTNAEDAQTYIDCVLKKLFEKGVINPVTLREDLNSSMVFCLS